MRSHQEKLKIFHQLHHTGELFIAPNAWDAGTSRILEQLGYPAIATTSAGLAFALGVRDSAACLSQAAVLSNAQDIAKATSLPVSADLENGFGDAPEAVADTIKKAFSAGLCGCTIEDVSGNPDKPIYEFEHSVERIVAAVEAKPDPHFMLTARTENFITGNPDLDDTIRRLSAFEAAGADVLYAPGLPDLTAVKEVTQSLTKPLNVVIGLTSAAYSIDELREAGVKRISTGGSLARAALGEFIRAATELHNQESYNYAQHAISSDDALAMMSSEPLS